MTSKRQDKLISASATISSTSSPFTPNLRSKAMLRLPKPSFEVADWHHTQISKAVGYNLEAHKEAWLKYLHTYSLTDEWFQAEATKRLLQKKN
jgi:hypothetical protein